MKNITIQATNEELNALENILTIDYQGDADKYQKDRSKCLDLLGKLQKQYDK